MQRSRSFALRILAVTAAALSATGADGRQPAPEPARPPNVILILADDIGVEGFGFEGGTSYATPHLDTLAASGMRFTHAYSQPLCTPSRVKLLTGRSNLRNYVRFSLLDPSERTIAHVLGGADYATGAVGKWQLLGARHYGRWAGRGTHPRDAGFETWCLWQVAALGSRYDDPRLDVDGALEEVAGGYGPDAFGDWARRYIDDHRDEPFFLYYPMALVHDPFVPTPGTVDREQDRQANFADMVTHMDTVVGRLVAHLEERGLREQTLVIFTSDNGTHKSIVSESRGKTIRGGKGTTTNAGTHVPLLVSWPGTIDGGTTCGDLVDFSDMMPTLAEITGASLPNDRIIDGRSFAPQLRGKTGTPRDWLFCYHNPRPGNARFVERRFVRDHRWKLYGDGRFHDLESDPDEKQPMLDENLDEASRRARDRLRDALGLWPGTAERLEPDRP